MAALSKIGNVSAKSVFKHTDRDWSEWVAVLDRCGGRILDHRELVALLKKKFRLSTWWQQEVARGYQVAVGQRVEHQTLKGTYTTTATKTIAVSAAKLFAFLISDEGLEIWLSPLSEMKFETGTPYERMGGVFGEVRGFTRGKKIRLTWIDEEWPRKTTLQLHLVPRGEGKCMIVIDHIDLPTMKAKNDMHAHWRKVVDRLSETLMPQRLRKRR